MNPNRQSEVVLVRCVWALTLLSWLWFALLVADEDALSLCLGEQQWSRLDGFVLSAIVSTISPGAMVVVWAAMFATMMLPLLIQPLLHLRSQQGGLYAAEAMAIYVMAYTAVWTLTGMVVMTVAFVTRILFPGSLWPWLTLFFLAFIWQASPQKRWALQRCKRLPALVATTAQQALRETAMFGMSYAMFCVVACLPLMAAVMLVPDWHMITMAATAAFIWRERVGRPAMGKLPVWLRETLKRENPRPIRDDHPT